MDIKQRSEESLRDYLTHFTNESLQVSDPNDQVTIVAFFSGLLSGRLTIQFHEDYLESLDDI